MKRWYATLILVLSLTLPLGPALAGGTDFIMGNLTDNVVTLVVTAQSSQGLNTNRLSMQRYQSDTGPGYILTLSPISDTDPCYYSDQASVSPSGKDFPMPGPDNITQLYVQISDLNGYNKTHGLEFNWDDLCHLRCIVSVVSK